MELVIGVIVAAVLITLYACATYIGWVWSSRRGHGPPVMITRPHSHRWGDHVLHANTHWVVTEVRGASVLLRRPWPTWARLLTAAVTGIYWPVWLPIVLLARWIGWWPKIDQRYYVIPRVD